MWFTGKWWRIKILHPFSNTNEGYTQIEYLFVYFPGVAEYIIWHFRWCTGKVEVFIFAHVGVAEYHASGNVIPHQFNLYDSPV